MRFALVNNERVEAQPKLKGLCPGCSQPVTAKCGTRRSKHWAHLPDKPCDDRWWEPETEWHRAWKNNFPHEWQESVQHDQSGEKHIADVRTSHGLVIEFQHSHLDPQERVSRERFYGNMVWVVDGTRLKRAYPRFLKGMHRRITIAEGWFLVDCPEECFPLDWVGSSALVLFDFRGNTPADPPDAIREGLWCILPRRAGRYAVVTAISRKHFLDEASKAPHVLQGHEALVGDIERHLQRQNARQQRVSLYPANTWGYRVPRRRSRRF